MDTMDIMIENLHMDIHKRNDPMVEEEGKAKYLSDDEIDNRGVKNDLT